MNSWIISSWLQTNAITPYEQKISNVTNGSTQALLKNDVLKFNILLLYSSTIYLYIHRYSTSIITFKSPWYSTIINTKVRKELTVPWWILWADEVKNIREKTNTQKLTSQVLSDHCLTLTLRVAPGGRHITPTQDTNIFIRAVKVGGVRIKVPLVPAVVVLFTTAAVGQVHRLLSRAVNQETLAHTSWTDPEAK